MVKKHTRHELTTVVLVVLVVKHHLGHNSQQWCWICSQTTPGTRSHSSGVRLVVRQHIRHDLTAVVKQHIWHELSSVVLGLWPDNIWGTNSQQWCWACSQLDKIRARIYSIGFGLVVRQHIGNELIAVV